MPETKTMDAVTLLQQHGWRVAVIIACLSLAIRAVLSSGTSFGYCGSILVSLLCLNWLKNEFSTAYKRRHLPPGDLGLPFVGETLGFFLNPSAYGRKKQAKYGDTYTENTIALGIVFGHEKDISWLWNTERKGRAQGMWPPHIRALLGKGAVANLTGKRHRMLRRMLEPAFAPNATRDYVQVLDQATQESLEKWSATDSFHSSAEFKMFALRLFFIAGFGYVDEEWINQLHDDFSIWLSGFGSLVPLRIPGTLFSKAMNARDRILVTVETLIETFKRENPPDSERAKKSMMGRVCYGTDEDGNPMDSQDLKDNVLNLIFAGRRSKGDASYILLFYSVLTVSASAYRFYVEMYSNFFVSRSLPGHDTTYASMGTALHYLSEHAAVQAALIEEVQSFQEPLDFDELKNAPVLNAFLAESWRMDPPVAGAFRKLRENTEYKGYKLPKDIVVRYNILAATRNDNVYPTPSQFEIQRYLPQDHPFLLDSSLEAKGVDYNNLKANYPVFGGGSHSCLGSHFAKLEMRVLLTRLLQKYDLRVRNCDKVHFPVNGWKNEFKLTAK